MPLPPAYFGSVDPRLYGIHAVPLRSGARKAELQLTFWVTANGVADGALFDASINGCDFSR